MTAITAARSSLDAGPARGRRAGLAGALRSEFTKLRSVRSTYWALLLLVLAGIAWSVANCAGEAAHWAQLPPGQRAFDATQDSVVGLALLGQLVVVVLGTLAITSEYSTGMIRTSLTVLPRRGVVFTAKAVVLAAVTLAVALATSLAAFFTGQYLLRSTHQAATLGQPDVLRAVLATALYVVLSGLFSLGLGAMLRSTAGALTAAYGLLFLIPQLAKALPSQWYADSVRWLPGGDVINAITSTERQLPQHVFSAWGEFAVFGGYTAIVLAAGALLLRRRDA
ncbi:MAG TPA: ABC transporter permease subunit [Streptosporangiaceae bacterium]